MIEISQHVMREKLMVRLRERLIGQAIEKGPYGAGANPGAAPGRDSFLGVTGAPHC